MPPGFTASTTKSQILATGTKPITTHHGDIFKWRRRRTEAGIHAVAHTTHIAATLQCDNFGNIPSNNVFQKYKINTTINAPRIDTHQSSREAVPRNVCTIRLCNCTFILSPWR